MHFLDELTWRGLIQDMSDEAALRSVPEGASFYVGFDPTAPSLQLGNLVPLLAALHLARWGLKPIILFGGATGAIGDPSGKSKERPLLERAEIEANIAVQTRQAQALFGRVNVEAEFVNNYDWSAGLSMIEFLRDVGKHFPVNYMIAKEVVRARLEGEGLSYTEFSYMLLQAHDFLQLLQNRGCAVQIGGSDQWGNITAGLELIRRKQAGAACAFSIPLITDSEGRKFGKSEGGAVWLAADLTSPYALHQFLLNTPDSEALRYLRILTFCEPAEIEQYADALERDPQKREAQTRLADEVCTLVHGPEAAADAKRGARVLFGGSLEGVSDSLLEDIIRDVPSCELSRSEVGELPVIDLLVRIGACKSKGEAKKLVKAGGAYINNQRISDGLEPASAAGIEERRLFLVRTGKKAYYVVRLS